MGFRGPIALTVLIAAAAPLAVAMAQQSASSSAPTSSAPASSAAAAAPAAASTAAAAATAADATKAAEAAYAALRATKTTPGDAAKGKTEAVACGACHGADGNSAAPEYPKLAAQNPEYIVTQLMRFKSGTRVNAIMQGMASTLTPQQMVDIAAYFSSQKRTPGVADAKLATLGEKLYQQGDAAQGVPACMACHGPSGEGNPGWRVPNIAGQHQQYVETQLQAWHNGTTWGTGVHASIMPMISKHLTEQDISAVSSYVQGLHAAAPDKAAAHADAID